MVTVQTNADMDVRTWTAYVLSHSEGTLQHLPQWRAVLMQCYPHRPYYLFAFDDDGQLRGILPMFHIRSRITGSRLVSLPFSGVCGPIADSEEVSSLLIKEASDLSDRLGCKYLELRMARPLNAGLQAVQSYSTFVLHMADATTVWQKLDPKSVRWAIRKADKQGVTVRRGEGEHDVAEFYRLNQETKKRLGVPWPSLRFFRTLADEMGPMFRLYLAEADGSTIGAAVFLLFKDIVQYAYAASDERFLSLMPNDLLLWRAIEESCEEGYQAFDFGRTALGNEGLARFKRHWGTAELKLSYYYHPTAPILMSLHRGGPRYRAATTIWKNTPLLVARYAAPWLYRHLD